MASSDDDEECQSRTPLKSTTMATSTNMNAAANERICHALPVNIDFQGMASTHVYFRPSEPVDGVVSSTFRGRGLLALTPPPPELNEEHNIDNTATRPSFLPAALLSVHNDQLQIKAEIDTILEWQHEHNPETLLLTAANTGSSRVRLAHEWTEVAWALHESIPVEES